MPTFDPEFSDPQTSLLYFLVHNRPLERRGVGVGVGGGGGQRGGGGGISCLLIPRAAGDIKNYVLHVSMWVEQTRPRFCGLLLI